MLTASAETDPFAGIVKLRGEATAAPVSPNSVTVAVICDAFGFVSTRTGSKPVVVKCGATRNDEAWSMGCPGANSNDSDRLMIAVAATGRLAEIRAENVPAAGFAPKADAGSLSEACAVTVCEIVIPACSPRALNRVTVTVLFVVPGFTITSSVLLVASSRITGTTCVVRGMEDSAPSSVVTKSPEK